MADAFPGAKAGWVEEQEGDLWTIETTPAFDERVEWLRKNSPFDIMSFVEIQLVRGPFDDTRRRLEIDEIGKTGVLAYRTFRVIFCYDEQARKIILTGLRSGYTSDELQSPEDKYSDKTLHREFVRLFEMHP